MITIVTLLPLMKSLQVDYVKKNSMWGLEYNSVSLGDAWFPYGTSLELVESELDNDFNTWLTCDEIGYFGELSHAEYEK